MTPSIFKKIKFKCIFTRGNIGKNMLKRLHRRDFEKIYKYSVIYCFLINKLRKKSQKKHKKIFLFIDNGVFFVYNVTN